MLIGELWAAETKARGDLWWWRNSSARWVRRRRRSWSAPPQHRRGRAADIRSILATAGAAPVPRPAGESLADVLTLPMVPTRSLDAYKINTGTGEDGDQPW
jgi:hypothetical protein